MAKKKNKRKAKKAAKADVAFAATMPVGFKTKTPIRDLVLQQYDDEVKDAVKNVIDRSIPMPPIGGERIDPLESFRTALTILRDTQPKVMKIIDEFFPE